MSVKVFMVMAPPELPDVGPDPEWQAEQMVFVKDGFSFAALLFPFIWLIWHRMWLPLLGYLAYLIVISTVEFSFGQTVSAVIVVAVAILFALEANNLRRWSLAAKGWTTIGEAVGRNREEAEFLYFRDMAARTAPARPSSPAETKNAARAADHQVRAAARPDDEPDIFGLFPEADR